MIMVNFLDKAMLVTGIKLRSLPMGWFVRRVLVLIMGVGLIYANSANTTAQAAGDAEKPPKMNWSFSGPFGQFDQAQLQRGYKVYRQVCASCHALENVAFRHFDALGYDATEIRAIAAKYQIEDGPDADGNMFLRTGIPSDLLPRPYENDAQAKAVNNGAYPANLSTITRARANGADYIVALLTGYQDPPEGIELADGQYYNPYFEGKVLAMAEQLSDGLMDFDDGSPPTAKQYAKDVTAFLVWANEPTLVKRKQLGAKVIIFLIFFFLVAVAYQRRLWARLLPLKQD